MTYRSELERRMEAIEEAHNKIVRRAWAPFVFGLVAATGFWVCVYILSLTVGR